MFANGAILEGNAMTGPVYYTDPDGNFTELNLEGSDLTRNDFFFDPVLQLPIDGEGSALVRLHLQPHSNLAQVVVDSKRDPVHQRFLLLAVQ